MSSRRATALAVSALSPVTITTRTPSALSFATTSFDVSRSGSLNATSPA